MRTRCCGNTSRGNSESPRGTAILEPSAIPNRPGQRRTGPAEVEKRASPSAIDSAVSGLRRAGQQDPLILGLLTRAWQRSLTPSTSSGQAASDSAQGDLDEAWEIAECGPMPLFLANIHLHRARLFWKPESKPARAEEREGGRASSEGTSAARSNGEALHEPTRGC